MQSVHLDTDLGGDIDDLCALALLLKWPDVEITGITTVADENGRRAGYVRHVLALVGRDDVCVAAGADVSSEAFRLKPGYPDEQRYWGATIPPAPGDPAAALQLLEASIEQGAHIIGIGPYTNLAQLEQAHPGILQQVRLTLMGGYLGAPPAGFPAWGNEMDYNMQMDVAAARLVLERTCPLLVPLNVTVQTALCAADLPRLDTAAAGPLGALIARQARAFTQDWDNASAYGHLAHTPADLVNFQHDALTCAIALGWHAGVKITPLPLRLDVVDGWLHEQISEGGKITPVVTHIEGACFNHDWLDRVAGE